MNYRDKTKLLLTRQEYRHSGLNIPIGEAIIYNYTIVGVVDDFNMHTVRSKINPTIFICNPKEYP